MSRVSPLNAMGKVCSTVLLPSEFDCPCWYCGEPIPFKTPRIYRRFFGGRHPMFAHPECDEAHRHEMANQDWPENPPRIFARVYAIESFDPVI